MRWVDQPFPAKGLVYPKTDEKLPFMTWAEIRRRIKAGADADSLWQCLYLDTKEIEELLAYVQARRAPDSNYPMRATAAYTGAARIELMADPASRCPVRFQWTVAVSKINRVQVDA